MTPCSVGHDTHFRTFGGGAETDSPKFSTRPRTDICTLSQYGMYVRSNWARGRPLHLFWLISLEPESADFCWAHGAVPRLGKCKKAVLGLPESRAPSRNGIRKCYNSRPLHWASSSRRKPPGGVFFHGGSIPSCATGLFSLWGGTNLPL